MNKLDRMLHVIDKILDNDEYGEIDIIKAFKLELAYIKQFSYIVNSTPSTTIKNFLALTRLMRLLTPSQLYLLSQEVLDNLPVEVWRKLSYHSSLKESFIVKNVHNFNLNILKEYRKGDFSHRFHEKLPWFKTLNGCSMCFDKMAFQHKMCKDCLKQENVVEIEPGVWQWRDPAE